MHEDFDEQARGAHALVGGVLVGFGAFALTAGVVLGWVLEADLRFLTPIDIIVIACWMLFLGAWLRTGARA